MLAQMCTDSAKRMSATMDLKHGVDCTKSLSLLTRILDWNFKTETFEQDFSAWETVKAKYEQQTGQPLFSSQRCQLFSRIFD